MTTKFLDYKNCAFRSLLSWRFPRKTAFLDEVPLCPNPPPESANFILTVVSPSLRDEEDQGGSVRRTDAEGACKSARVFPGRSFLEAPCGDCPHGHACFPGTEHLSA